MLGFDKKKIVFISGLHKSGTSILHRILSGCQDISGFKGTGVPEDEGQHLQTVYQPAKFYGGPGRFAFNEEARLDENSDLINAGNRQKLLIEWGKFWDHEKTVFIEKSPPNLIRTRFLQSLFPDAYFITIIRHPVPVSLATQKWSKTTLDDLIRHWLIAYRIYLQDSPFLKHRLLLSYEEMVSDPVLILNSIGDFLELKIYTGDRPSNKNPKYFDIWTENPKKDFITEKERMIEEFETQVNAFGYSLIDLDRSPSLASLNEPG